MAADCGAHSSDDTSGGESNERLDGMAATPPAVRPTEFADKSRRHSVVIACSFDPLGLQGPLQVWLHQLTGLRCALHWIRYGMTIDALRDPESAWGANRSGLNVLLLRWSDLGRSASDEKACASDLVAALRGSCAARRGPTLVLLPPTTEEGNTTQGGDAITAELCAVGGVRVVGSEALRAALDAGTDGAWHSPFLDRVAHAPYSPAANSLFASEICREICRACAPRRKVIEHMRTFHGRPAHCEPPMAVQHIANLPWPSSKPSDDRPRPSIRSIASTATTRCGAAR